MNLVECDWILGIYMHQFRLDCICGTSSDNEPRAINTTGHVSGWHKSVPNHRQRSQPWYSLALDSLYVRKQFRKGAAHNQHQTKKAQNLVIIDPFLIIESNLLLLFGGGSHGDGAAYWQLPNPCGRHFSMSWASEDWALDNGHLDLSPQGCLDVLAGM